MQENFSFVVVNWHKEQNTWQTLCGVNWCSTLVSPQSYTSLTLTKTDRKSGSGKLTAGYVRSLKCLSVYVRNCTLRDHGGFHVTAFIRTRQGFSSLSPNYNPADDCTSYRALLHYSKGGNEYFSITSDTLSFRPDERCDWSPPTRWQIWWQKEPFLSTPAFLQE